LSKLRPRWEHQLLGTLFVRRSVHSDATGGQTGRRHSSSSSNWHSASRRHLANTDSLQHSSARPPALRRMRRSK